MSVSSPLTGPTRFAGVPSFVLAMLLTVAYVETFALWRWLGTLVSPAAASAVPFVVTGLVLAVAMVAERTELTNEITSSAVHTSSANMARVKSLASAIDRSMASCITPIPPILDMGAVHVRADGDKWNERQPGC